MAHKFVLLTVVCAVTILFSPLVVATPIVVVRTGDCFVAGTNYVRSNGETHCKLHYVGNKVLLMSGDFTLARRTDLKTGKEVGDSFDLFKDIWSVFKQGVTDEQLLSDSVGAVSVDLTNFKRQYEIPPGSPGFPHGRFIPSSQIEDYHLVLLSTDGGGPHMLVEIVRFHLADPTHPKVIPVSVPATGILVWDKQGEPNWEKGSSGEASVKVKLEKIAKTQANISQHLAKPNHSFEAPFSIVELRLGEGLRFLDSNSSFCTVPHPILKRRQHR
jgi:hypothetical protein